MAASRQGSGPVDRAGRPLITKLGTIDCDLVETTPVVFKGRVYRCEWVRSGYYAYNVLKQNYGRLKDHETGTSCDPMATGYLFHSGFVEGDTAYVLGTVEGGAAPQRRVDIFASKDLRHWDSWPVLDWPQYHIFNTSLCKADGRYVLMFEIDEPKDETGVAFTARFATSTDLKHWELTPPECNYEKDRYTAPHCLRYLDGWFYDFYLEAYKGYETRVVRSKDLVHWQPSPLNPVLRASPEDKQIADPHLTPQERERIAAAVNINNSDIDFCEFDGKLIINYSWGNQEGKEFLAEAVYEGTQEQFLRGWYP